MNTFPVMLNLAGRRAVVVGGGAVGTRRAVQLLRAGAKVTVVTDRPPTADVARRLADATVILAPYDSRHLSGAAVVFACTDSRDVNSRIAAEGRLAGAIVNAADQNEDCDFFMPACWDDGPVTLAIGTAGAAPALAGWLRDLAAAAMPPRVGEFALAVGEIRQRLRHTVDPARRAAAIKGICCQAGYDAFLAGGAEALHRMIDLPEK